MKPTLYTNIKDKAAVFCSVRLRYQSYTINCEGERGETGGPALVATRWPVAAGSIAWQPRLNDYLHDRACIHFKRELCTCSLPAVSQSKQGKLSVGCICTYRNKRPTSVNPEHRRSVIAWIVSDVCHNSQVHNAFMHTCIHVHTYMYTHTCTLYHTSTATHKYTYIGYMYVLSQNCI